MRRSVRPLPLQMGRNRFASETDQYDSRCGHIHFDIPFNFGFIASKPARHQNEMIDLSHKQRTRFAILKRASKIDHWINADQRNAPIGNGAEFIAQSASGCG